MNTSVTITFTFRVFFKICHGDSHKKTFSVDFFPSFLFPILFLLTCLCHFVPKSNLALTLSHYMSLSQTEILGGVM